MQNGHPVLSLRRRKAGIDRISDALKDHRKAIAAYFADHEDRKERGNYIKTFFDNTFVEKILSDGQSRLPRL